jgi:hypothetical protein
MRLSWAAAIDTKWANHAPMRTWTAWTAPDRSIVFNNRIGSLGIGCSEAFRQIGHSLAALIVATLGGLFARNRYLVFARNGKPVHPA